jgi:hypothetical protein
VNAVVALDIVLAGLTRFAQLKAVIDQAALEGRSDLTDEEVAAFRRVAEEGNKALIARLETAPPSGQNLP